MDKALNYISLARKAGKAELGEEPAGAAARALHAHLIVVACDASDHTWRRAKSYAAGTDQQCIRLPYTKDDIGMAIGRTSLAIAAITDAALALALVQALPQPEKYAAAADVLTAKSQRQKKRQSEAKAHLRNRRSGKKKN
ncbi:MAG: 50S ribosomal protein L7 [Oscillospiraceae bacterium]|nr:50S ribosomal protein L7 [Oscillospiraceae bacterium]